jgi:ribosome-associated protein
MASIETRRMVLAASAACEDKKAEDTRILELDPSDSGFTDFFLITSGTNERQTTAIADEIELRLKREFGVYPNSVEGRKVGEWVLMDYVDFAVHIFLAERRAYYDIERLRKSAKAVDLATLKATLTEKTKEARKKTPAKKAESAPAKKTAAKKASAKKAAVKKATAPAKKTAKKSPAKPAAKKAAKKAAGKKK